MDLAAGLTVRARVGDRIEAGAPLVTLELGEREVAVEPMLERAVAAFRLADEVPPPAALVRRRLAG